MPGMLVAALVQLHLSSSKSHDARREVRLYVSGDGEWIKAYFEEFYKGSRFEKFKDSDLIIECFDREKSCQK